MKRIGVLGGLGPQATMDFEERVHAVSQQLIPARGNEGYPPMLVYYHRRPPVVVGDDRAPLWPLQVDPSLLDGARRLGEWADFLVITSNGVHRLQQEIEAAAGCAVLSMVDLTVAEVGRRGWRTVGLLTYIDPTVYQQPLEQRGVVCAVLDGARQARLDEVIPAVAAGTAGPSERAAVVEAVEELRGRGVDGVILGCTELPLLLGADADAPDLINPIKHLVDAAVRCAIEGTEQ